MLQDTLLAQAGARRDPATGAIAMPIHPSSAFQHPALGQSTGFDYSRTSNPTRLAFAA
jgi:cystathionine gamma-synthase